MSLIKGTSLLFFISNVFSPLMIVQLSLEGSGPAKVINGIAPPGFRFALYALFGVIATAGVTIAVTEGKTTDALVNGESIVE